MTNTDSIIEVDADTITLLKDSNGIVTKSRKIEEAIQTNMIKL